jgi:hypothetical protein
VAYRYCASGTLTIKERFLDRVCAILNSQAITYECTGTTVTIKHDEKAAVPSRQRPEEAFGELAKYIDTPQALTVYSELLGESEVGFVDGKVRLDMVEKVWCDHGDPPTPEAVVESLRARGIAAHIVSRRGSRKSGRRTRSFELQPGSGGLTLKVTIKRRYWDSYDLLSVPDIYKPLCEKYHLTPKSLRTYLTGAKYGIEVRNPALGGPSTELLFMSTLEVVEELTDGIRTTLG